MTDPYIGEIRMFAGTYAPDGWEFCDGQLLPISENDALFSLIGTRYGGDGRSTFALPDLRGRIPISHGRNSSRTYRTGEIGGVESVTLTDSQMPNHTHQPIASGDVADQTSPSGRLFANTDGVRAYVDRDPNGVMSDVFVGMAGGSMPHTNMQPFLCVSFIISLYGVYPQRP